MSKITPFIEATGFKSDTQPMVLVDDLVFDSNSPLFLHSSEIECVVSVSHEESDYSVLCSLRTD